MSDLGEERGVDGAAPERRETAERAGSPQLAVPAETQHGVPADEVGNVLRTRWITGRHGGAHPNGQGRRRPSTSTAIHRRRRRPDTPENLWRLE